MTRCPICYSGYQEIWKIKKHQIYILKTCQFSPFSSLVKDSKDVGNLSQTTMQYEKELDNHYYLTQLFSEPFTFDLCIATTFFQHFSKVFYRNHVQDKTSILFSHIQQFEFVFAKEDFDAIFDYCKWYYTIKLISSMELKLLKIYFLYLLQSSLSWTILLQRASILDVYNSQSSLQLHQCFYQEKKQIPLPSIRLQKFEYAYNQKQVSALLNL